MILRGQLILDPHQPPRDGWLRIEDRRIIQIGDGAGPDKPDAGDSRSLICPGFIDAHLHLPQFESIGADGLELLDWLDQVIFPAESRWVNPSTALAQIHAAHDQLLRAGTLGYAGYLTAHPHGIDCFIDAHRHLPLRAIAGQALMNRNGPTKLINHPLHSNITTDIARLQISINPRFAVACTDDLLGIAGQIAGTSTVIQTHLAESLHECALVKELFPNDVSYTAVYDRHGLLTDRTLLAHCVHLSDDEWRLIRQRNAVVVHCPAANTFLRSGLFDLAAARKHEIRLALGSDIAAGPDIAMPRVARAMIETAKVRSMTIDPEAYIPTTAEVWNLITRGNADALGWNDAGRLEIDAAADLLVLKPSFDFDEHLIGRLIHTWRDEYITHRILNGEFVSPSSAPDSLIA